MVDLQYVKKRKRKRIAQLVAACGTVVVAIFVIIAFLGNQVGTFTVTLRTSKVSLALSEHSDFKDSSSYLRITDVQSMGLFCYQDFKNRDGQFDITSIDDENTSYLDFVERDPNTGKIDRVPFFKYTFFVKNMGDVTAKYTMNINITQNTPSEGAQKRYLDGCLRFVLIENGTLGKFYAKRSIYNDHFDPNDPDFDPYKPECYNNLEYICGKPYTSLYEGQAEPFEDRDLIQSHSRENLTRNQMIRYTVLFWLEGHDDPEGYGDEPKGAKIELGVEINAYEN